VNQQEIFKKQEEEAIEPVNPQLFVFGDGLLCEVKKRLSEKEFLLKPEPRMMTLYNINESKLYLGSFYFVCPYPEIYLVQLIDKIKRNCIFCFLDWKGNETPFAKNILNKGLVNKLKSRLDELEFYSKLLTIRQEERDIELTNPQYYWKLQGLVSKARYLSGEEAIKGEIKENE